MLSVGAQPVPGLHLSRPLGSGGFGTVWEAQDKQGKRVALKFLSCRDSAASLIASEIRVLRGLSELKHPRFLPLLGVHAISHYIVLIMEYADGSLADLLLTYQEEAGRNIPPDHFLEMAEQVAEGLDFLARLQLPGLSRCSQGLQHCDIKPGNILLVGDDVKIADFGLCAATGYQTLQKGWRGTWPYAAPELYQGKPTLGTDQYALAITYLKLVVGERVFYPKEVHQSNPLALPVDLGKVRLTELPVLVRALHPQPASRWPSCTAFVAALRQAMNSIRPLPRSSRKSSACLQRIIPQERPRPADGKERSLPV